MKLGEIGDSPREWTMYICVCERTQYGGDRVRGRQGEEYDLSIWRMRAYNQLNKNESKNEMVRNLRHEGKG